MTNDKPVRIQRKRTRGFKLQAASPNGLPVVYVGRPTIYGNPFDDADEFMCWWEERGDTKSPYCGMYPDQMERLMWAMFQTEPHPLRGKNLACWCAPSDNCHADVLLDISNSWISRPCPVSIVAETNSTQRIPKEP